MRRTPSNASSLAVLTAMLPFFMRVRVKNAIISGSVIDTAMRRIPLNAYERAQHVGASRSDLSLPVPEIMSNAQDPV